MPDKMPAPFGLGPPKPQLVENYISVASFALLAFDYLLTFHLEVAYIWSGKISLTIVIFALARYTPFVVGALSLFSLFSTSPLNDPIFQATQWLLMFSIMFCFGISIIRTYAIWSSNIRVVYALCAIIVPMFIFGAILTTFNFEDKKKNAHLEKFEFVHFVHVLIFESLVVCLTLYKGIQHMRDGSLQRSRIIATLFRDGVLFFICEFMISVFNLVITLVLARPEAAFPKHFQMVTHSVLSTRIILHLRETAQGSVTESALETISMLHFAMRSRNVATRSEIEEVSRVRRRL